MNLKNSVIIGIILIVMCFGSFCQIVSAEDEGFVWIEAEDGVWNGNYGEYSCDSASGNKLVGFWVTGGAVSQLDLSLEITENNLYDIYYLGTDTNNDWLSKFKWKLDNDEFKYGPAAKTQEAVYYPIEGVCGAHWYKLCSQSLTEGTHTLSFLTDEPRSGASDNMWLHYVDVVVAVPSEWQWIPNNINKPIKKTIPIYKTVWNDFKTSTMSNNNGVSISGDLVSLVGVQPEGSEYCFTTYVKPYKEGDYDVYFLGSPAGVDWASTMYLSIGAEEFYTAASSEEYILSDVGYVSEMGIGIYWQKLGTFDFVEKRTAINVMYNTPRSADGAMVFGVDALVLVPCGTDVDFNTDNVARFSADLLKPALEIKGNLEKVIDDLELPQIICGERTVMWESSNNIVVSIDGTVNRPDCEEPSEKVFLKATCDVSRGGKTYLMEKEFEVTVLPKDSYEVQEFALKYDDGSNVGSVIDSNKTLKASLMIADNTGKGNSAVLLLVLYDADGAMVSAASKKCILSETLMNESIELPLQGLNLDGDLIGYRAEAFLWDSINTMHLINSKIINNLGGI